jgi:hypothetical protein
MITIEGVFLYTMRQHKIGNSCVVFRVCRKHNIDLTKYVDAIAHCSSKGIVTNLKVVYHQELKTTKWINVQEVVDKILKF